MNNIYNPAMPGSPISKDVDYRNNATCKQYSSKKSPSLQCKRKNEASWSSKKVRTSQCTTRYCIDCLSKNKKCANCKNPFNESVVKSANSACRVNQKNQGKEPLSEKESDTETTGTVSLIENEIMALQMMMFLLKSRNLKALRHFLRLKQAIPGYGVDAALVGWKDRIQLLPGTEPAIIIYKNYY